MHVSACSGMNHVLITSEVRYHYKDTFRKRQEGFPTKHFFRTAKEDLEMKTMLVYTI